ncbi:uncharacterized protein CDAR_198931 [Caerostris darwini]|uniref:Complex I assembly factor TIMMDC1, mitochondrial n=1 Tax=Caerostris darwini TaxID=1538125 RepID=A0AAV4TB34_9ARAC|nr:uncharacterized protein CDAR_198931 [Caerostris darwini]
MYTIDEFGFSPELQCMITTAKYTIATAAFFGGISSMIKAKDDFFRKNMASAYESKHLARRSLSDAMSLAGIRGALKSAFKYGTFSSFYLLATMTGANYRNKISVWEHVASGAVLGGLARCNYGFKGVLVAGTLGGFLGFIAGGIITLTFKIEGVTMDDLRCWQHEDHYTRLNKDKTDQQV